MIDDAFHEAWGKELLTPAEVATIFKVHVKTVSRWEEQRKLTSIRTPGGHRRYYSTEVKALLDESRTAREE